LLRWKVGNKDETKIKEMTVKEISAKLGYDVKIIKEYGLLDSEIAEGNNNFELEQKNESRKSE
jgi:hypothetical protein